MQVNDSLQSERKEAEGREPRSRVVDLPLTHNRVGRGQNRRSATGGKPILDNREMRRFRDEQQSKKNGNQRQDERGGAASKQLALRQERDEAFVGRAFGIFVQQIMKLRRGGEGRGAQPENEHQTDHEDFANPALTVRFITELHDGTTEVPLLMERKLYLSSQYAELTSPLERHSNNTI